MLYSYSYQASSSPSSPSTVENDETTSTTVSMKEGERLVLLEKSNADWWQVCFGFPISLFGFQQMIFLFLLRSDVQGIRADRFTLQPRICTRTA